jgi:hypothetical protein
VTSTRPIPPERTEKHNISVDDELADAGRCGQVHLPTGRICVREHPHPGSCEFITPDAAHDVVGSEAARLTHHQGEVT